MKRRKEYLEPKQHARLRDQIEHLWAVDKRFRNWSLLAKAAGLSSGQAVKRAYEVNSSMATLRNIDTFARLHAGFGSKATQALRSGVPIDRLQAHLTGVGAEEDAASTADSGPDSNGNGGSAARAGKDASRGKQSGGRQATPAPFTMDDLGETPPTVDFSSMVEAGQAVDTEVKRLWLVAQFFERMSTRDDLPHAVRNGAATARHHVMKAVEQFAPANGEPASGAPEPSQSSDIPNGSPSVN